MIKIALYGVLTVVLLAGGYIVSVFSNAVFIEPDQIRELFPDMSDRRKREMEQFAADPRAFFQIAYLVRITSALGLGLLGLLIAQQITAFHLMPPAVVYLLVAVIIWPVTMIFFIYLPRRASPVNVGTGLIRLLPLVNLIYRLGLPVVSALRRLPQRAGASEITEEQKDDIVERAIETLAESAGISTPLIEEDEKEMIHGIFQLDVTEVQEVMVPRVNIIALSANADSETVRDTVRKYGYSRYPVYDGTIDNIIGVVPVKDLLLLSQSEQTDFHLDRHVRKPLLVGRHKKIDQLLGEFKKTKTHMAVVVDEFGGTAGLITLEDILEEIVGDIQDEHDPDSREDIIRLSGGNLEVSGACSLEDLAHELDMDLDQEQFETVAGLIYDLVGSIPAEGTALNWKNARLKVLKVEGQQIKRVLVIPSP
ncbi:MAG: hemolysin family protein [candidate division Zixibacteria bacterium]|nr:hemolysin family protein [candidate division Zixibacteria bacterium]